MMKKKKIGIVGCGRIAYRHVEAMFYSGRYEIVWLFDVKEEMALSLADYVKRVFGYMPQVLSSLDTLDIQHVDVITITTPNVYHLSSIKDFWSFSDEFVVEKPVVMDSKEWNELNMLSQKKKIYISHQLRYLPVYEYVKSLISEDKLGKLSHISINMWWNRNKEYFEQAEWRGTWKYDGGMLFNQGIHFLDLGVFFASAKPLEITVKWSNRLHPYIETDDVALGYITFENGVLLSVSSTISALPQNIRSELAVFGDKGTIVVNNGDITHFYVEGEKLPPLYKVPHYYGHKVLYDHVYVGEGITIEDVKTTMEILFEIYRR